jgi:hypothetical protein
MPQFQPLPSSQHDNAAEMIGEQFREVLSTPLTMTTEPLRASGEQKTITESLISSPLLYRHQNEPLPSTAGPLYDTLTTPSLVAALQATMSPTTKSRIVVIPGSKKRAAAAASAQQTAVPKRIPGKIRQGITLAALSLILLLTLLSLAPLDSGQGTFHLFSGVVQWARTQQQQLTILAHTLAIAQGAPTAQVTTSAPMPLPTSQYVAIAQQDALNAGISPTYFVRQINQESGFNPNAVSPAGAVGIAQFLPSTAAGLGINPWDPLQALSAAAHMMASYANKYGGDYAKALAAYNAGDGTVQYAINTCGPISWMNCLPAETQNYIHTIMGT